MFLVDKLAFFLCLRHRPEIPRVHCIIRRGRVERVPGAPTVAALDDLVAIIERDGAVVLKRIRGSGGAAVHLIRASAGQLTINGRPATRFELHELISRLDGFLATEFVEQAAYARDIAPGSTNTLRMMTMPDVDGVPFLAGVAHRFGSAASGPVDNLSQGGMSCAVDPETGILGDALGYPWGRNERTDTHPDSGARFVGAKIPDWAGVVASVLDIAAELPFVPYVGWDVVVTDNGVKILEGNRHVGVDVVQVHRPLLADPRVRRFYALYGIGTG